MITSADGNNNLIHGHPILHRTDRWIFRTGIFLLILLAVFTSRANLVADSVDYYAILQWLTPAQEQPIVDNLHFAQQRSPGYSMLALIPYFLLSTCVDPLVHTLQIQLTETNPDPHSHEPLSGTDHNLDRNLPPDRPHPPIHLIPPQPLLLFQVPFKDFYVPPQGSWYQWKLSMSLALTSFTMLFLGITAISFCLRQQNSQTPYYSLIILMIFSSPFFLANVSVIPLYATMTAFGASSFFVCFLVHGFKQPNPITLFLSGVFLGLLVLTRLETAVFAVTVILGLIALYKFRVCFLLCSGACWSVVAWMLFNWKVHGTFFFFGIFQGDINLLEFNIRYILECLVHPGSGIFIWTPLLAPGLFFLFRSQSNLLRILGYASLIFLCLCALRIPVMYHHIGSGRMDIGGIPVPVPSTASEMRALIRSDNNRYIVILFPVLILALREGISKYRLFKNQPETGISVPMENQTS